MQTEAAPKEPFTLGVLLRYKTTILVVAVVIILGGYVRIITQPAFYEATARLAVRFTGEAIAMQDVGGGNVRLPLLEEEVKAYMVQITDPRFIDEVLQKGIHPEDETAPGEPGGAAPEGPPEPGAGERFRKQFLTAYYQIRSAILSFIDAILLTPEGMLSERQQEVMKVLGRLEVSAGTEASHIITVTFRNIVPTTAAATVNAIALHFIEVQKSRMQKEDVEKFKADLDAAKQQLVKVKTDLYEIQSRLGSPTIEAAIQRRSIRLDELKDELGRLKVVGKLLDQNIMAYDSKTPIGSEFVIGELERQYFTYLVQYDEQAQRVTEESEFYRKRGERAGKILEEQRARILGKYRQTIDGRIAFVEEEIKRIEMDRSAVELAPEFSRLLGLEETSQAQVSLTEQALLAAQEFNEQLENESVSQNVMLWQRAQVPPFPVPQHRGLKLMVVIVLGILAGCALALLRHQIRPKKVRRIRPRHEEEAGVPLFLVPDEAKRRGPSAPRSDVEISFPPGEGGPRPPP